MTVIICILTALISSQESLIKAITNKSISDKMKQLRIKSCKYITVSNSEL